MQTVAPVKFSIECQISLKRLGLGIDTFFDDNYLLKEIKSENSKAVEVKRMSRKILLEDGTAKYVPKQSIVVSFLGTILPKYVTINSVLFEVEPYIYSVIQCYNHDTIKGKI